jgi:transcription initiation factor TFIIIB Brf1 subunit/transcription initiation factor TFIIB
MSEPWGGPDNVCPKCGSADVNPANEGSWPECNECGFVQYDEDTLALQREVQREQATAKQVLGYVPDYREAVEKGFCKP